MSLTKAEIADKLYEELGLNKREAKEFVEIFFGEITKILISGADVKILSNFISNLKWNIFLARLDINFFCRNRNVVIPI